MFYLSDAAIVLRDVLGVLKYASLVFLLPVLVGLAYQEFSLVPVFAGMGATLFLASAGLLKAVKPEQETEQRHAMVTVALVWLLMAGLGAVPFLSAGIPFTDGVFESMSGWTTTGFSILPDVEALPHTLLFWRSLMQWMGGIGIVVAVLSGLFRTGGTLFLAEGREERIKPNIRNTIGMMWKIYLLYTAAGVAFFLLAGMPLFDSLNHAMTGISTGGMSVKNAGVAAYGSPLVEAVFMALMLLGAVSFLAHFTLLKGGIRSFLKDTQVRALALILLASSLALSLSPLPLWDSAFQAISALTNSGFSTIDVPGMQGSAFFLLIVLMFIGGSAGSTVGGIKLLRLVIFLKSVSWRVRRLITPGVFFPRKVGERTLEDKDIRDTSLFIALFLCSLLAGSIVLVGLGYPAGNAMFESASALATTGLSAGIVSPGMPFLGKLTLILLMWVGRLEIWAVLTLIGAVAIRR